MPILDAGGRYIGDVYIFIFPPGYGVASTSACYACAPLSVVAAVIGTYTILEGCYRGAAYPQGSSSCAGTVGYTIGWPPPPPPSPPPLPPQPPSPPLPPGAAVCAPFDSSAATLSTSQALYMASWGNYDVYASCSITLAAGQMLTAGFSNGGRYTGYVTIFAFAAGDTSFIANGNTYEPLSLLASAAGSYTILQGCNHGYSCSGTVA